MSGFGLDPGITLASKRARVSISVIGIIMITNQVIMIAIKHDYRDSGAAARSDTPPSDEHGGVREDALSCLLWPAWFILIAARAGRS